MTDNENPFMTLPEKNPFMDLPNKNMKMSDAFKNPGWFKKDLIKQQRERSLGGKRGLVDIGQTGQQLFTKVFHPEKYDELTKKLDTERASYMASPEGKDPGIQANRQFLSHLPEGIGMIGAIGATGGFGLPALIGAGAASGALGSQLKYFPEGKSRKKAAIEEGILGGALPGIAKVGSSALGKIISPLLHKINPRKTASIIQNRHDAELKTAENLFDTTESEAKKRGMGTLPIPEGLISESERFFPKTDAYRNLIEKAKTGDYSSIRKLQSDLGKQGRDLKSSSMQAERDKGDEAFDLRRKVNEEVSNSFELFGHGDLKENLLQANKIYKSLKDIYYSHPTISKLVKPGLRKIPKNINNVLMEMSEPMENIRKIHPELENEIKLSDSKGKSMKLLKELLKISSAGAAGGAVYRGTEHSGLLNDLLGND